MLLLLLLFVLDGSDYVSERVDLIFFPDEPQVCFNMTIIDDDDYEDSETFTVILDSMDEGVLIVSMEATITITDNDGESKGRRVDKYRDLMGCEHKLGSRRNQQYYIILHMAMHYHKSHYFNSFKVM